MITSLSLIYYVEAAVTGPVEKGCKNYHNWRRSVLSEIKVIPLKR